MRNTGAYAPVFVQANMSPSVAEIVEFLTTVPPYDILQKEERERMARQMSCRDYPAGQVVYQVNDLLGGVFILMSGEVETTDRYGALVSLVAARNTFGERGFLRDGHAATTARTT